MSEEELGLACKAACQDPKKSWDFAEKIHDLNDKVVATAVELTLAVHEYKK